MRRALREADCFAIEAPSRAQREHEARNQGRAARVRFYLCEPCRPFGGLDDRRLSMALYSIVG